MDANSIIEEYLINNQFEDLKYYEGLYKINKEGKIWSMKSKKLLTYTKDKGVDRIGLMINGKQQRYNINELLAIQYEGKINKHMNKPDLTNFEDLKDYEGSYKINREGKIWSNYYNKFMEYHLSDDGYLKISLVKDGIKFHASIHRLLAIQYIPNIDNLPEVDHIDRNKQNNSIENLRWADKCIQNNNKSNCLSNKTEEELKIREDKIREYKRQWAENNRRQKGIPIKEAQPIEVIREKNRIRTATKRASMTEEEKQKHLERRRELYAQKEHSEEYKQKAIERARKHAEKKKLEKSLFKN